MKIGFVGLQSQSAVVNEESDDESSGDDLMSFDMI